MQVYTFTNKGGQSINEDTIATKIFDNGGVFILADGLGGHRSGEVASKAVVNELYQKSNHELKVECLSALFEYVNELLLKKQRKTGLSNMKTTAVYLNLFENKALWGHVGDSRLYYISSNQIKMITKDHSVSFKKYQSGDITYAQINNDDDRSSLLSVFGAKERFNPEFFETKVQPTDAFLICSDGFWEYIYNEEILVDYLKSNTPKEWAEYLLLRHIARTRPNNDNFSLITIFV